MTKQEIIDRIYQIGCGYITTSDVNPGIILGGTWEKVSGNYMIKISNGEIVINNGDSFISSDTTVNTGYTTLYKSQCPNHTHDINGSYNAISGSAQYVMVPNLTEAQAASYNQLSLDSWGGASHNHAMSHTHEYEPTNIKVYLWKRIG